MIEKKVAIIGAGPAGYTLAQELVKEGCSITIYEQEEEIGGAIYTGIPDFRMPKTFLKKVYDSLVESGVCFHFHTHVDKNLFQEICRSYDCVAVAIGAQVENTFGFETGNGVCAGLSLLYDLNRKHMEEQYRQYHKAIVWGGGNVAMDCARSLARLIPAVTIVYRRSLKEMPAHESEVRVAEKEGVTIAYLTNIKDMIRNEQGKLTGVHAVKMALGEEDASGRASCHEVVGSDFVIDADLCVMAIGQKVDFGTLQDTLQIETGHHTNQEGVWVLGDAYTGPKTIGRAVMEGKQVASEMLESLR